MLPEEEAWMTQAFCDQKGRKTQREKRVREREERERGRGRHAGDRGEWEHTHFCNLIRESSRLLTSACKGQGHVHTHTHTHTNTNRHEPILFHAREETQT